MDNETKQESNQPQDVRPYWLPDVPMEDLPEGLRVAVDTIIRPGYEELVMGAQGPMEQLAGMSAVHLAHLEILDQFELASASTASAEDRHKKVAAHVKLSGAKLRALSFVQRLREARDKPGREHRAPKTPGHKPQS